jgi:hypothetical protein
VRSQEAPSATGHVRLPDSVKNNVAVLTARNPAAPGGVTTVYVLGMSHVSKKSCDHVRLLSTSPVCAYVIIYPHDMLTTIHHVHLQVRELVAAVKPEVVSVELCRERLGLLVDPDIKAKDLWHTRKVSRHNETHQFHIFPIHSIQKLQPALAVYVGMTFQVPPVWQPWQPVSNTSCKHTHCTQCTG